MTKSYSEIPIPNSEVVILSAKRTFPAEIYICRSDLTDITIVVVDYISCGFDVMMSNN